MIRLTLLMFIMAPMILGAQSIKEEVELFQSIYGMEKKKVAAEFTGLTTESNKGFWMLYDDYEDKRKAIGQERISLIFNYVDHYQSLTDEQLDYLVSQTMKHRVRLDKLIKTYHKKIKKVAGSEIAAQFVQMEAYFLSATRSELIETLPVIGKYKD